ncbi:unnamed protein product [Adineta steineri]|uniref:NHL repeat containing protein n=1 Tax=Adineta steineri TaxID=433720 RepID=A0A818NBW2_9BILA|nr:unnamed protein product [Adineta steineri]
MFCLNYLQCYLLTFDLSSNRCEIFSNISIDYGNLIRHQDVITMITLDNEQLFNSMSHKIAEASNIKSIMANRMTPTIANTGGTITTARETTTSSSTTATTITSKINTAIHVSSSIKSNDATIAITTTNETNTNSTTTNSTSSNKTASKTNTNSCTATSTTSTTSSSTSSCTTASEATTSSASSTTKNPCTSGNLLWNKTGITILSSSSPIITSGVFIDLNDKLYAADENANYIVSKLLKKVPDTMVVAETFGSPKLNSSQLNFVNDLYVDIYGNIYITDTRNYRIQKYINGSKNATTTIAGVNGSAGSALNQLNTSRYFTFDSTDTYMYIVDSGNHRILRYSTNSTSGTYGTLVAGGTGASNANTSLNSPWGIHYLPSISNDLFITNTDGHSVIRWTPGASSGVFVVGKPGVSGSNSTLLNYPTGIKLDNYMNIYVADTQNNRIQLFCANSNTGTTIAGNGSAGSDATQLDGPRGIAFDSAMNMYIGDTGNLRVQKFMKL